MRQATLEATSIMYLLSVSGIALGCLPAAVLGQCPGPSCLFHVPSNNLEQGNAHIVRACSIYEPLQRCPWRGREVTFLDPSGHPAAHVSSLLPQPCSVASVTARRKHWLRCEPGQIRHVSLLTGLEADLGTRSRTPSKRDWFILSQGSVARVPC
jgi:hypothetical protein